MALHARVGTLAALVVASVFCASPPITAQATTGTILGTVTDETGGVLPGTTITLRHAGTGMTRAIVTDERGGYREVQLPIGTYEVKAELAGFQTQVRPSLVLTVGGELVVGFKLGPSAIAETLVVTGDAPVVQTTSSEVSALVDSKQLRALPLNARDIQQLAVLQPGVQQDNYSNFGKQIVVSGTRPQQNRFLLNGIDQTFTFATSPVSAAGVMMGIEAVEEFKLLTSSFGVAYGERSGGIMNTVTKSGTNEFHGSGYEFARNDAFDAKNYFDNFGKPPFTRHQFGASIGGPIATGRTFFFLNVEDFYSRLHLSNLAIVPSARARQGYLPDATGQEAFVGVNPAIAPYVALFPTPNGRTFADGTAEAFTSPLQKVDDKYMTMRVDHTLGPKTTISGIYTGDWSNEFTPTTVPAFADHRTYNKHIASVQAVHTFSPRFVGTTRVGVNKTWYFYRTDTTVPVDRSMYFVPDPFFAPTEQGQFGVISVSGLSKGLGQNVSNTTITPRWFPYWMGTVTSDFNYTRGTHAIQFGGSFKRTWDNSVVANPPSRGNYSFLSLRNFLLGTPSTFQVYVPSQSVLGRDWRNNVYGFFVQDDIKLRSNLTANVGVRYEFQQGPSERNGRISNLRGGYVDPTPTIGAPYFKNPMNLIAPRGGLNWDPSGNGRMSIRLGGGIFYDEINPYFYFLNGPGNLPFTRNVTVSNPPFPNALAAIPATSLPDFTGIEYAPHAPTKYSYNATFQRDLGRSISWMAAYVGSKSRFQARTSSVNTFIPTIQPDGTYFWPAGLTQRPNPSFRNVSMVFFDSNTDYNSFQTTLDRRVSRGVAFTVNYTYSVSYDDLSSATGGGALNGGGTLQYGRDRTSSHGPSAWNARNAVSVMLTLDLPGRGMTGAAGKLLGGWQLSTITSATSGVPFDVTLGYHNSRQGESGAGPDRPSWAPGCDASKAITGTPDQWFDPLCFVSANPGFLGNVPARILRGPSIFTSDWAFIKSAGLGTRRLQLRAEVFNIFNRANFAAPSVLSVFNSDRTRNAAAGRITQTVTPSRQMQFGVKFVF
jgi:carboxypeptidase family protein/TonB-dependent receptor-like protein